MKSFREKLIEVANVSYLSYCKLNSVDSDVKRGGPYWVVHGPGPGGGPWTGGQRQPLQNTPAYQILPFCLEKQESYKAFHITYYDVIMTS